MTTGGSLKYCDYVTLSVQLYGLIAVARSRTAVHTKGREKESYNNIAHGSEITK